MKNIKLINNTLKIKISKKKKNKSMGFMKLN